MLRPTPAFSKGGLNKIVYERNEKPVMVRWLKYYCDENVYIKPITENGL
jgi:hypothetical protein